MKVEIDQLRPGVTLRCPIFDSRSDRQVLLLAAGSTITEGMLLRLKERGIGSVRINVDDLRRMRSALVDAPEADIPLDLAELGATRRDVYLGLDQAAGTPQMPSNAFLSKVRDHGDAQYEEERIEKFSESYDASLNQVEGLFKCLESRRPGDARLTASISEASLMEIAEDMDLFVSIGIKPEADKYPPRHSLQTAMLAMSMGACLRLQEHQLIELGIGCLLHDIGMLHLNHKVYEAKRKLTKGEFLEVTKHPLIAFDVLRRVKSVSGSSLGVVFQMHERCNGSGYPRRLKGSRITHAAKIAAVADVFLALVSPRPYRRGMLPYFAVAQILNDTKLGLFDKYAVRGLLHATSLFPIGSYVEVSDGRVGRVVRSNGAAFTRPILELWSRDDLKAAPDVINLHAHRELSIVRPLSGIGRAA